MARVTALQREVADSKLSRGQIIIQVGLGTYLATANRGRFRPRETASSRRGFLGIEVLALVSVISTKLT
jgi:hypothetical protein